MDIDDVDLEEFERFKVTFEYLPKSCKCMVCGSFVQEDDSVLIRKDESGDVREADVVGARCRKTHEAKKKNASLGKWA